MCPVVEVGQVDEGCCARSADQGDAQHDEVSQHAYYPEVGRLGRNESVAVIEWTALVVSLQVRMYECILVAEFDNDGNNPHKAVN